MKGCPLECVWCHSPESQKQEPELVQFEHKCLGLDICKKCLNICSTRSLSTGKTFYSKTRKVYIEIPEINRKTCVNCGKCTEVCSAGALYMSGKRMSIEEVLEEIDRDVPFYMRSGGGVTISGGEPLLQHKFTTELFRKCKKKGIHTCLDTCGYASWEHFKNVLKFVDLVLYDIKQMNSAKHLEFTGVPNELILKNARKVARERKAMIIRIPLIPGYTDSEENIRAIVEFCLGLGPVVQYIHLIPYHRLGLSKYKMLGRKYKLESLKPPSKGFLSYLKDVVSSYGMKVKVG